MDHPHILLISLETLRRDHLHCYGYSKAIAPNIDRVAEGGVRCADSVANCGWTLPQHMTLLTGLYPLTHGCTRLRESPPLGEHQRLLSEHLKEHGYRTFAGVSKRNAYGGGKQFGFARGFDEHVPEVIGHHPLRPMLGRIDAYDGKVLATHFLDTWTDDSIGLLKRSFAT